MNSIENVDFEKIIANLNITYTSNDAIHYYTPESFKKALIANGLCYANHGIQIELILEKFRYVPNFDDWGAWSK